MCCHVGTPTYLLYNTCGLKQAEHLEPSIQRWKWLCSPEQTFAKCNNCYISVVAQLQCKLVVPVTFAAAIAVVAAVAVPLLMRGICRMNSYHIKSVHVVTRMQTPYIAHSVTQVDLSKQANAICQIRWQVHYTTRCNATQCITAQHNIA